MTAAKPEYDVFLCYKHTDTKRQPTKDVKLALQIHNHLTRPDPTGQLPELKVFCADKSLSKLGAADYAEAIDAALECSQVLVAVGTSKDNLNSRWPKYEWSSFHNEIRSGKKPNGKIFTYIAEMNEDDLPYALRQYSVIKHEKTMRSLEELERYVRAAVSKVVRSGLGPGVKPGPGAAKVPVLPGEWLVQAAEDDPTFLTQLHDLHDWVSQEAGDTTEVVITLYACSFDVSGVGSFEYDLVYCRNIRDDAPMFGPLVKDDDRRKFIDSGQAMEVNENATSKPGGFIEREGIKSNAKFRLAPAVWDGSTAAGVEQAKSKTAGLLFINGRNAPIKADVFDSKIFRDKLSKLTETIKEIGNARSVKSNKKLAKLTERPIWDDEAGKLISAETTGAVLQQVLGQVAKIMEHENIVLSAYLSVASKTTGDHCLKWLWSNRPTSAPATCHLSDTTATRRLLFADVAADSNNKPLLVHNVRAKAAYRNRIVRTTLGEKVAVNLAVPILSKGKDKRLRGVLDLQGEEPDQFDADDVRFLYGLSNVGLSQLFAKLQGADEHVLPLRNVHPYFPFNKVALDVNVNELLALNFNPMKFLFHWDKIRELLTKGTTSAPATVEIWPNMVCNHGCSWCRTKRDQQIQADANTEMTAKTLRRIGEDLKSFGSLDILISGGGEPLLHEQILELIAPLADAEGIVGIFTNGTRPADFRFWEAFFKNEQRHRFVRVSFNGHDPESYYRIHGNGNDRRTAPITGNEMYAEARKIILDLLGWRSGRTSIAIGDTVQFRQIKEIPRKAKHASDMEVDFIQMRPELFESTRFAQRGKDVCKKIECTKDEYGNETFAVIHTDGERSFHAHDEKRCYAMQLVPTLVPDFEPGWTRVMPCSYAINTWGEVPDLGRIQEGASLSDFWKALNRKLEHQPTRADRKAGAGNSDGAPEFVVQIDGPIEPVKGCPQCRYYQLNKRIERIAEQIDKLPLVDELVEALNRDPDNLSEDLCQRIKAAWGDDTIDLKLARDAFKMSRSLNIKPSL